MLRPVKLRAKWRGRPPAAGMFLKSPRGRIVYEITAVQEIKPPPPSGYQYRLTCARHLPGDIPPEATVQEWIWDKRKK